MAEQVRDQPATGCDDLGQVAYLAESAWLDEIVGGCHTPWDDLEPEHRGVYQRIASTVATRIAAAVKARADELAAAAVNAGGPDGLAARARAQGWEQAAAFILEDR